MHRPLVRARAWGAGLRGAGSWHLMGFGYGVACDEGWDVKERDSAHVVANADTDDGRGGSGRARRTALSRRAMRSLPARVRCGDRVRSWIRSRGRAHAQAVVDGVDGVGVAVGPEGREALLGVRPVRAAARREQHQHDVHAVAPAPAQHGDHLLHPARAGAGSLTLTSQVWTPPPSPCAHAPSQTRHAAAEPVSPTSMAPT